MTGPSPADDSPQHLVAERDLRNAECEDESMNILVLNAGSSSLKFEVIAVGPKEDVLDEHRQLISGVVEDIGKQTTFSLLENKEVVQREKIKVSDYGTATQWLLNWLDAGDFHNVPRLRNLAAVGHRVVHGADRFTESVFIDAEVISGIEALEDLAPLHNAPAVDVIRASRDVLGTAVPMFAVFDTAFHCCLPPQASSYPLPFELSRKHHIRRYGFHGISHEYLAWRYARITDQPLESVTIITLHLESGCSACAIRNGQSVDTSMGLTPLEGLMMGMRSGDIDPSIVGYLARKEGVSVERVEQWLNKKSGLLGISGRSH